MVKMWLNSKWTPQKDGVVNQEFFKWLRNCNKEDHKKLCMHLLSLTRDRRIYGYPKVTIKQTSKVLESYYSAKEWLEHRKRIIIVRQELNKIKPSLGFFNISAVF